MGWLSGFGVTLRQIGRPKVTERFPKEKRPYFFLQRMESHGSGTVTRLVKIRHFLNLIARRDRVKKGGCHCR